MSGLSIRIPLTRELHGILGRTGNAASRSDSNRTYASEHSGQQRVSSPVHGHSKMTSKSRSPSNIDRSLIKAADLRLRRRLERGWPLDYREAIDLAKSLIFIGHYARAKYWLWQSRNENLAIFMLAELYAESRSVRASKECKHLLDSLRVRSAEFDNKTTKKINILREEMTKRNFDPHAGRVSSNIRLRATERLEPRTHPNYLRSFDNLPRRSADAAFKANVSARQEAQISRTRLGWLFYVTMLVILSIIIPRLIKLFGLLSPGRKFEIDFVFIFRWAIVWYAVQIVFNALNLKSPGTLPIGQRQPTAIIALGCLLIGALLMYTAYR